jgi:hypothetical protein
VTAPVVEHENQGHCQNAGSHGWNATPVGLKNEVLQLHPGAQRQKENPQTTPIAQYSATVTLTAEMGEKE